MLRILALAAAIAAVNADFIQLQEVCRTTEDELGLCVTSPFCCTALGGTIGTEAKASAVARGSMPSYLARAIGEDSNKGCSYNGQCCIFPDINNFQCDTCGLKGNGDREKERLELTTPPPTTTTASVEKLITERIVNGQEAERYEWCWQVALMNSTGLFGGGSLIARNWVVTAAHKVAGKFLDEFVVVLGEYDFLHAKTGERVYYSTALNVHLHEGFNPDNFDNNIALIRIPDAPCEEDNVCAVCLNDDPITFEPTTTTTTGTSSTTIFTTTEQTTTTTYAYGDANAQRVSVAFSLDASLAQINNQQSRRVGGGGSVVIDSGVGGAINPFADVVCYMTGWGSTGVTQLAPTLVEALMSIIRSDTCEQAFIDVGVADPVFPEGTFCAADASLTRGSCYGDGGGPLVCQNRLDHSWELFGVISLGTNMCMTGGQSGPTLLSDVGLYFDWITETIHEDLPLAGAAEGKIYKVPECGNDVSEDGTIPCPDRPAYQSFNRRSSVAINQGDISAQQMATLTF